jgi:hypothetical protein
MFYVPACFHGGAEATGVWSGDAIDSIERLGLVVRSGNEVFWRCISQWQIFEVVVVDVQQKLLALVQFLQNSARRHWGPLCIGCG